jgi:hypothetical protein
MITMNKLRGGPRDPANLLEGKVEILAYKRGELFYHEELKNIILFQGQAEIIRALSVISPATTPRVITRMVVGDQGTIPSDPTVPKVPAKDMTGLFHEVYRKDIEARTPTLYSTTGFSVTGNTTNGSQLLTGLSSTVGIVVGMVVTGTGIPQGAVVAAITGPTTVQISAAATSSNSSISITFVGTVNECQFVATFDAADVALTAFSNPSQPRINEVGLVIIDPTAGGGLVRSPVTAPALSGSTLSADVTVGSPVLTNISSTAGITTNMRISGTGIPANAVVVSKTLTTVTMSANAFLTTAGASVNFTDEVVMSIRTFKSVPFEAANDITITIRYTIFTE